MKSFSAIVLAGFAAAAPADLTCTQKSQKVKEWTVSDFDLHASYTFTNPAHQNSWGYVSFKLANPALGYTSSCQGSSNQLQDFFYGNFVYNCTGPAPSDLATFTFSRPTNELMVNQTWACSGEGSRFWAEGGTKLDLNCHEEKWQNPSWEQGQIYSTDTITCDHVNAKVPVTSIRAVA